jgi:hypothetical protein
VTPTIVATMVVRDEVDIIAANLDHLLHQGVRQILVTDNGSRDGTREVLAWYAENRPVTVFDQPVGPFWQSKWVTTMARMAATDYEADWVVHIDADEFLFHPNMSLPEVFASVDDEADVVVIPRWDYVALEGAVGDVAPLTQLIRKSQSLNPMGRPLLPKVAHRADVGATVTDGNHEADGPMLNRTLTVQGLVLRHYPARSLTQTRRKIANLSDGYRASGLDRQGIGGTQMERRRMLDLGTFEAEYRTVYGRRPAEVEDGLADGSLIYDPATAHVVSQARSGAQNASPSRLSASVERWLSTASEAGVRSHRIDSLLSSDVRHRREMTIFHMQTQEMIREVRALVDGPMVLMKGIEVAQLYPESWRRDFVDVDILVGDVEAADVALRRAGFGAFQSASTLPGYHQTAPLVRSDNPVTIELHRRPSSPRWAHFPSQEVIAQSRPSRTGIDGVMRPRDDHHVLIVAWHFWRDGAHRARDLVDLHLLRQQTSDGDIEATADAWQVGKVWRATRVLLDALEDDGDSVPRAFRALLNLGPVSHRDRRLRQWWGISMGGRGAFSEVLERGVRRRQRGT